MGKNLGILLAAAAVVALPFLLREPRRSGESNGAPAAGGGRPVLTVITSHNEAIRQEFGRAFSRWHAEKFGTPVELRWIVIGGTTEIARYLESEYATAARGWWQRGGRAWQPGMAEVLLDRKFDTSKPPAVGRKPDETDAAYEARRAESEARWKEFRDLHARFRATDDPREFTSKLDLFFGGGQYDHYKAWGQGMTVAPWPAGRIPAGLMVSDDGAELLPEKLSGETWRGETYFSAALSTFGICYNKDRLRDLGVPAPARWDDLVAPAFAGRLGVVDPTKSGSIAKAFEMIIHEKCAEAVRRAGFETAAVDGYEKAIAAAKLPPGQLPGGVPAAYQAAIEQGWLDGVRLIQRIGANARYFSESSSKIPLDVAMGQAAAGLAIDFYARFQIEHSRAPDGTERMGFVTPAGGSSVSGDPISLLRGAEHRELGVRFIEFVLGEEGQRLWAYRVGEPGGPHRFALRRLPARRDFYPSDDPRLQSRFERHRPHLADDFSAPDINPYELAKHFVYRPRWTAAHFGIQRDLVRAMCLDAHEELRRAWLAVLAAGGPERRPEAMRALGRMPDRPVPLTWRTALDYGAKTDRMEYLTDWTSFFRQSYREAERLAR